MGHFDYLIIVLCINILYIVIVELFQVALTIFKPF